MVCLDNLHAGVEGFNHLADFLELILSDQILLIDDKCGTELNLLNQKRFNILFAAVFLQQHVSACKLIHQTGSVNNTDHIVQDSVFYHKKFLCNRHGLAHTGSLNQKIVELSGLDKFFNVLSHLALKRTADASVCKRHNA